MAEGMQDVCSVPETLFSVYFRFGDFGILEKIDNRLIITVPGRVAGNQFFYSRRIKRNPGCIANPRILNPTDMLSKAVAQGRSP